MIAPEPGDTFESHLLSRGLVTNESLARAKRAQQSDADSLTTILVKLGILAEKPLAEALAAYTGFPLVTTKDFPAQPPPTPRLSEGLLREAIVAPIASDANGVTVAMADPLDASALEAVRYAAGTKIFVQVALGGRWACEAQGCQRGREEGAKRHCTRVVALPRADDVHVVLSKHGRPEERRPKNKTGTLRLSQGGP